MKTLSIKLGATLCLFLYPFAGRANIIITEVFENPNDEDHDEMIEIMNTGTDPFDVTGLTLTDGDALDAVIPWVAEFGTIRDPDALIGQSGIKPGGFALILDQEYAAGNQPFDVPLGTMIFTTDNTTIGNGLTTTDPITVFAKTGEVLSTYGTPKNAATWQDRDDDGLDAIPFNPGDGLSVERIDLQIGDSEKNWKTSEESAGHSAGFFSLKTKEPPEDEGDEDSNEEKSPPQPPENSPPPDAGTCSFDVLISEIFPNPIGPDNENEFIELSIKGSKPFSLKQWSVSDQAGSSYIFPDITVNPGTYFVVKRNESHIALNNSGDESVILTCAAGSEVDRAQIQEGGREGMAYALLKGKFSWTSEPTPGKENVMKRPNEVPIADFDIDGTLVVKFRLTFDAGDSVDPDQDPLHFEWDFGDSQSAEGQIVKHSYQTSGIKHIGLTVNDGISEISIKKDIRISHETKGSDSSPSEYRGNNDDFDDQKKEGPTTSPFILLTGLMPNPDGPDALFEWIEIQNMSEKDVVIRGWKIRDQKNIFFIPTQTMPPRQTLVFTREQTKITLQNKKETVYLVDGFDHIVNGVSFEKARLGQEFRRMGSSEEWQWVGGNDDEKRSGTNELDSDADEDQDNSFEPRSPLTVSISTIQSVSKGSLVSVTGTVTGLPGERGVQKLFISDGLEELQIYSHKKNFPELGLGDTVNVKGAVSEAGGVKRVNIQSASDIAVLSAVSRGPLEESDHAPHLVKGANAESPEPKPESIQIENGSNPLTAPWIIIGMFGANAVLWVLVMKFKLHEKFSKIS